MEILSSIMLHDSKKKTWESDKSKIWIGKSLSILKLIHNAILRLRTNAYIDHNVENRQFCSTKKASDYVFGS